MNLPDLLARLESKTQSKPRKSGAGYTCRCPAHEDKNPSLTVSEGRGGKLLVKCQAGCGFKDIAAKLDLKEADFFPDKSKPGGSGDGRAAATARRTWREPVAVYPYRDESGAVLFEVCRFEPGDNGELKTFRQRRPDKTGLGGYTWKTSGVRQVPFRLPELLAAVKASETIYVAEGEKDVAALVKAAFVATCNAGGAGKWRAELAQHFAGCKAVAIIADKDAPGRKHAVAVAAALAPAVPSVRVLELPDVNGQAVKDAADFFTAGGTAEQLRELVAKAPEFKAAAATDQCPVDVGQLLAEARLRGFDAYFEEYRGRYFIRRGKGYTAHKDTALRRELRLAGFSDRRFVGGATELDAKLVEIERNQAVRYALPLAGYAVGVHEICGHRFLVADSPKLATGAAGDWKVTRAFLLGLFSAEQLIYILGWLQSALATLRANGSRPGQAVALCGPSSCGKSLFQGWFTEFIGGRACKPFNFLMGETIFNEELCCAEHWMVEDEAHSYDPRKRAQFGSRVKNAVANETVAFHPKGRTPIQIRIFKRVTISLNDEPENLFVLPIFNDSVAEKIMLFRAREFEWPMPMDTDEQKAIFRKALSSELPAFVWHLEREFRLPDALRHSRYSVATWHHPELLEVLHSLSPENKLLSLLDRAGQALFGDAGNDFWLGRAADLEDTLRKLFPREVEGLIHYTGQFPQLLAGLGKRCPERVEKADTNKERRWLVRPA
jgi:hypothetical protein